MSPIQSRIVVLKPIRESTADYEAIEAKIVQLFRREIYLPILRKLKGPISSRVLNAKENPLVKSIRTGRVQFVRGQFLGKFNASISKELKALGARFDRKSGGWRLPTEELPPDVLRAIEASRAEFEKKISEVDQTLSKILPEEIAGRLDVYRNFDGTLKKVDKEFMRTIYGLTVAPKLTDEQRGRIAEEWQSNLRIFIKQFSEKEIFDLRKYMQQSVFAGNRYETAIKTIEKSYDVSFNKAKFLARQETGLLMAKFKEVRYQDAGVKKYKWTCVTGTSTHPVRPEHKALDGKIFSWDHPRELDKDGRVNPSGAHKPGDNKNPGEDFNCRCYAKPIVEFGRTS